MTDYNIKNVGKATVEKKFIRCDFSLNYNSFATKFAQEIASLPTGATKELSQAIATKKETKIDKNNFDVFETFFGKVKDAAEKEASAAPARGVKSGFSADEQEEAAKSGAMKQQDVESKDIKYQDKDSKPGIQTYSKKTGKEIGTITLGEAGETGEVVIVEAIEKIEAKFDFNGEKPKDEDRSTSGLFKITNPSNRNRIWDIDIDIKKGKEVDLPEHIYVKNLEPSDKKGDGEKKEDAPAAEESTTEESKKKKKKSTKSENAEKGVYSLEYKVKEVADPTIMVKEVISTQNNETESYSLTANQENVVLFTITVTNTADYELRNITVKKAIEEGFSNVSIKNASIGEAKEEEKKILWTIEKLDAKAEAKLSVTMSIKVENADEKKRSGKVDVEYFADKSVTGLEIDSFDAYSDNFVGMEVEQQDDNPDKFNCSVIFENRSDFQVQLVNLDIIDMNTKAKVCDVDAEDLPRIAATAKWQSVPWVSESKDDLEPEFQKTVEFFLLADRKVSTQGVISIDDIELAVAMLVGKLQYSLTKLESFREVPFTALLQIKNIGGASINDLTFEDIVPANFIPPKADDIGIYIVRPEVEGKVDKEFPAVEIKDDTDYGEEIKLDPSLIEITPNDQEPTVEHTIKINMTNLKESNSGMFIPGMIVRAKYPLKANRVAKDTKYTSNVKFIANTFPAGKPMEVIPEQIEIPVVHVRKKTIKGKEVRALPEAGTYEIILFLENQGTTDLENVKIKDVVPKAFEYTDQTMDCKAESQDGKDVLVWDIPKIEPNGGKIEIKYKLKGTGDYKASEAQFSL